MTCVWNHFPTFAKCRSRACVCGGCVGCRGCVGGCVCVCVFSTVQSYAEQDMSSLSDVTL